MALVVNRGWLVALVLATTEVCAADADWVAQSNANAAPLLEVMARYAPETAAAFGVEGHDTEILDLEPGYDTRFETDLAGVVADLQSRLAAATDPRVRQDLQILVTAARDQSNTSQLNRRLMLPYFDLGQVLFRSFDTLLDPRVGKERYPAALTRLRATRAPSRATRRSPSWPARASRSGSRSPG